MSFKTDDLQGYFFLTSFQSHGASFRCGLTATACDEVRQPPIAWFVEGAKPWMSLLAREWRDCSKDLEVLLIAFSHDAPMRMRRKKLHHTLYPKHKLVRIELLAQEQEWERPTMAQTLDRWIGCHKLAQVKHKPVKYIPSRELWRCRRLHSFD